MIAEVDKMKKSNIFKNKSNILKIIGISLLLCLLLASAVSAEEITIIPPDNTLTTSNTLTNTPTTSTTDFDLAGNYLENLNNVLSSSGNGNYYNPITVPDVDTNSIPQFIVYETFANWLKTSSSGEKYISVEEVAKSSLEPTTNVTGHAVLIIIAFIIFLICIFQQSNIGYLALVLVIATDLLCTYFSGFNPFVVTLSLIFASICVALTIHRLVKS